MLNRLVRRSIGSEESGQTLVVVTLALIALIGFLALAIDVGVLYSWRRNMQNAADAGALAAARVICTEGFDKISDAESAARHFAVAENRATTAEVTWDDYNQVRVTASADVNLFFARVLGVSESGVTATAVAACGSAEGGCFLWPIALASPVRDAYLKPSHPCGAAATQFVLLDSTKICGGCDQANDGTYFCFDCVEDTVFQGNRGWVYFPPVSKTDYGKNIQWGANSLKEWIKYIYPEQIGAPVCLGGKSGVVNKGFEDAGTHIGRHVAVPVFVGVSSVGYCPPSYTYEDGTTLPYTKQPPDLNFNDLYHIAYYACVEVMSGERSYQLRGLSFDPKKSCNPSNDCETVKAILVRKSCENCFEGCTTTTGGYPAPGGLSGVSLVE
jgi:hypothetical protein